MNEVSTDNGSIPEFPDADMIDDRPLERHMNEQFINPITPAFQSSRQQLIFANDLKAAVAHRYRVIELPQRAPEYDHTIKEARRDQEEHVVNLITAMYNLTDVAETPDSRDYMLFQRGSADYAPECDVEAACRVLFEKLLDRCMNGFRGLMKDPSARIIRRVPRKYEADRNSSCATRIQNVVTALKKYKRICRDVLYDDEKMALFVHSPLVYCSSIRVIKDRNVQASDGEKVDTRDEASTVDQTTVSFHKPMPGSFSSVDGDTFQSSGWENNRNVTPHNNPYSMDNSPTFVNRGLNQLNQPIDSPGEKNVDYATLVGPVAISLGYELDICSGRWYKPS